MRFEIKKLFSSIFMWICLGLVIAFMSVYIIIPGIYSNPDRIYKSFLEQLNSQNLSEKELIEYLSSERIVLLKKCSELGDERFNVKGEFSENIWTDFMLFNRALETARYVFEEIPENRTSIVKDSLRTISAENAKSNPDMSVIRMNNLAVEKYNRIIDCRLMDTGDFDTIYSDFDNTAWDFVMIVFTVILAARMFSMDISRGAYKIIFSSANGRKKLYFKQLSACALIAGGLILLQTLCQIICGAVFFGVDNLSMPIQMIKDYEFCPYNISLGGFFAIKTLGKLLFYFSCIAVTALIAVLSRKALLSAAAAIILCVAPKILSNYFCSAANNESTSIFARDTFNVMRCFIPQSLLNAKMYFRELDYAEIADFPLSRLLCVMLVTTVIIIAGVAISCRRFGRETR